MEFRKKPVVIQAVQLTRENKAAVQEWCGGTQFAEGEGVVGVAIVTLEGIMSARFGDWVIRGVQGEFYPCKADIFEATYESAVG